MPGPPPMPVQGDETLPKEVDVVVIGGGIIGASTALELSERGLRVALCEKGGIGHEQSSRNWGWVRIARRDPREVPLMAEAIRIWQGLDVRLTRDTGYRQAGLVYLANTKQEADVHARWLRHLEPQQIPGRVVTDATLRELFPGTDTGAVAALHTPADGRAEPQKVAPSFAEAARDKGATILTNCAVRGVETEGGKISGVGTERGRIACSGVVLAGGAWSNLFCGNSGLDLPQMRVINHVMRTEPVDGGPEQAVKHKDFSIRKRQDGGYTVATGTRNTVDIVPDSFRYARKFLPALRMNHRDLQFRVGGQFFKEMKRPRRWRLDETSPFELERVLDPIPSERMLAGTLEAAAGVFPALKGTKIAQRWAGCIDVTPDAIPVISAVDSLPGFYLATGFSGHGFGIGPAAGRLMADIVTSSAPCVDPHDFRFSRFSDGSRIQPDEGI